MSAAPLISCIMPTYNRRTFAPRAIVYFLRKDYASKELINEPAVRAKLGLGTTSQVIR